LKILFVCTGNVDRSKTADEMFKDMNGMRCEVLGQVSPPMFVYQENWLTGQKSSL